jgi:hypothetical protein
MIVSQLLGGLGNQFFQYAMGRALAEKHRAGLKLDTSQFDQYRLRTYALSHFHIKATQLTSREYRELGLPSKARTRAGRLIDRLFRISSMPVVRENRFGFDASAMDSPSNCYLQGYWQSPKYFSAIESAIRAELTVREPLSGRNRDIADEIRDGLSVSVHVRRGDYVTNPNTRDYHGFCEPEYYEMAQRRMKERFGPVRFFVFSDDPAWVSANLKFVSPATIVDHNGTEQDHEDLRLMSLCRHHIIANSTFSWWGAWLSESPDKMIVAPKAWFREGGQRTDDLIPESWVRL